MGMGFIVGLEHLKAVRLDWIGRLIRSGIKISLLGQLVLIDGCIHRSEGVIWNTTRGGYRHVAQFEST